MTATLLAAPPVAAPPVADSTDLLARVRAGCPGAWEELVERFTPLLRSRIRGHRLQDADALDVMQSTWLLLAENLHRIHTPGHLAGWLATVVSRECLRVGKHRGRVVCVEDRFVFSADGGPGPEQLAVADDVRRLLGSALDTLTPQRRALVEALFADDRQPYADIARELDMPVGSLGPTRARILCELRRVLEQTGLVSR